MPVFLYIFGLRFQHELINQIPLNRNSVESSNSFLNKEASLWFIINLRHDEKYKNPNSENEKNNKTKMNT